MKAEIIIQPTDVSSDGGSSTCSSDLVPLEEWSYWGRRRSRSVDHPSQDQFVETPTTKRRVFWIVVLLSTVFLVTGVILVSVLLPTGKTYDKLVGGTPYDMEPTLYDVEPTSYDVEPTSMVSPATSSPTPSKTTPTVFQTPAPTTAPTTTLLTLQPTSATSTTLSPTQAPAIPTIEPTLEGDNLPAFQSLDPTSTTFGTFCVIADVPYSDNEAITLRDQIATQMEGCEFLVHLGDIKHGDTACTEDRYITMKDILLESSIPTFIVPGDNEWNDCGSSDAVDAAWGMWEDHLLNLEDNWNHTFSIVRKIDRPENFYFLHQRTLIFGLNVVGGSVRNATEWSTRLTTLSSWVKQVVALHVPDYASGVIIMAHAELKENHKTFSDELRRLVRDDWDNQFPFLYIHGDGHAFRYRPGYLNQPNLMAIQSEGGTRNPILKILMDPSANGPHVENAFQVDRQL